MTKEALNARSLVPSLTVNDLTRSTRFYSDGLGFSTKQEMKDGEKLVGVILEGGGASLPAPRANRNMGQVPPDM